MSAETESQETESQETESQETESQETESQETESQETESQETESHRSKKSAQQRINEITKAKYEAERAAAYWKGIAEGRTPQAQPAIEQPQEPAVKPNLSDFTDYETYIEALTDWKTEQKIAQVTNHQRAATAQERQQFEAIELAKSWADRQGAARKSIPDYDEVMGGADTIVSPSVTDAILTSDRGPEVAYHLAKNPALAERLNRLSPIAAAREIGRIEAALEKSSPGTTRKPPPAPANTTRSSATFSNDPAKMSHDQYRAMRAKQGARWAR